MGYPAGKITRLSSSGEPYRSRWIGMPRIRKDFLECAIYVYESVEDIEEKVSAGGSGFLVGVASEAYPRTGYIYAVTNRHVVEGHHKPAIRFNTRDGQADPKETRNADWTFAPGKVDLAICQVEDLLPSKYVFRHIQREMFLTQSLVRELNVGPGDEVFLVGRLVSHEGEERNLPVVRFGNIAMDPLEPLWHPVYKEHRQESYLVEVRSISGHSGSPVFVEIVDYLKRDEVPSVVEKSGIYLLGVNWCHLGGPSKSVRGTPKGGWVSSNSGMAGVIPAWRLDELLMLPKLVESRARQDLELADKMARLPVLD